jgi:hypothetical protein
VVAWPSLVEVRGWLEEKRGVFKRREAVVVQLPLVEVRWWLHGYPQEKWGGREATSKKAEG